MTNRLDRLEKRGLIRRTPNPGDRRGVLLELTPDGQARLDKYIEAGASRDRQLLAHLTTDEQQQLDSLLSKLLASIETRNTDGANDSHRRRPT
jgi:DNA-binding MarR family transcriptional regulator